MSTFIKKNQKKIKKPNSIVHTRMDRDILEKSKMKKRVFRFVFPFLLLLLFFLVTTLVLVERNANFSIKTQPKYVIFGHSHPECAFNDSLILNFKNLAASGESYFYSYFKAKKVLEQNPSITTVFVEYTNNQIDSSVSAWIWDEKYISRSYKTYLPFMNIDDNWLLFRNNPVSVIKSFLLPRENGEAIIKNFDFSESLGGYNYRGKSKIDSLLNTEMQLDDCGETKISWCSIKYLDKIVDLCREHKKQIFFVRSPQHRNYNFKNNEGNFHRIRDSLFKDINFLDFNNFPLADVDYSDLEHLNYRGAKVFSKWFNNLLERGLLTGSPTQKLIDSEMNFLQ